MVNIDIRHSVLFLNSLKIIGFKPEQARHNLCSILLQVVAIMIIEYYTVVN